MENKQTKPNYLLFKEIHLKHKSGTSVVVQWLRIRLPMQGMQVRSLVGELREPLLESPHAATTEPARSGACAPQGRARYAATKIPRAATKT